MEHATNGKLGEARTGTQWSPSSVVAGSGLDYAHIRTGECKCIWDTVLTYKRVSIDLASGSKHSEARLKIHSAETFGRFPNRSFSILAIQLESVLANTREPSGYLPAMTSV